MKQDNNEHNVIIHEFCHKIDMLNRGANGPPPIPANSSEADWKHIFNDAYERLLRQLHRHQKTSINTYASQSPVEFLLYPVNTFLQQLSTYSIISSMFMTNSFYFINRTQQNA